VSPSFRTKLLASHVGLVVAVVAISIFTLNRWMTDDLVRQLDQRLEEQAKGATEWADEGGRRHPEKIVARIAHIVDAEVTLFDPQGNVLAASTKEAAADMGPEVSSGKATRLRGGQEFHYVAVRGADGNVLRLAVPLSDVNETVASMQRRLLFASALAVLLAIALGFLASRVASRPLADMTETASRLAKGDFDVPIEGEGKDEFGVLWGALKSLAQQLKARIGELVAERDRLSAILAGMVEGVLVVDEDGAIVVANPAAKTILGTSELVGARLAQAVKNDELRTHVESGHESELEVVDERGASIAVYVRRLPEGATVAVLRDMTALRKLMTVRRDFVANVSHELRTPVTSIQGYAETLLEGKTDAATQKQFLEIVHRQAQRIGLLVEQLLALSELESRGRDDVAREAVAISDVARHVAETVRGRATIEVSAPDDVVARADREGLERAVLNLVDNAIKYGKESGVVRIAAKNEAAKVVVTVRDDGPGIAPEHLGRLFERFYRIDPGRSRQHGGAGLGLSIVKHLVESMDGTISVESDVGKGTTFRIELPTGS
jgi:two-component system phosphate regulon sensor histidine kinase PhoR